MKYPNDNIDARVERWLKHGDELNLAECDANADDLGRRASDVRVARSVRTLRLADAGGNPQFVDLRGCTAWEERRSADPSLLGPGGLSSGGEPPLGVPVRT